jgi:putative ABC transport system substrate-binding protein
VKRREFIALVGGAAAAWPLVVRAQKRSMPVIGFLHTTDPYPPSLDEFRKGLAESGYHESENVWIEYRWAEGHYDRLPAFAADLVRRQVDVIVAAGGGISGLAAKAATGTIPIVVSSGDDPVKLGFASSLNRPDRNITGVAQLVVEAEQKRLELLRELVPNTNTIAYLANLSSPNAERQVRDIESEARGLGLKLSVLKVSSESDFEGAFTTIAQEQMGALLVGNDPFYFTERDQLVALSVRHAVPTMYFFREFAVAGGLISYGTRLAVGYHQVGVYTGKILRGAKPANLPIVQQSEKIELVINLKTAKALGLAVPVSLLTRADEVIE